MSSTKVPNIPYRERRDGESFYIYADTNALLSGRGFRRMTALTRRLSSHLQENELQAQPNGYSSATSQSTPKLRSSKPRLMLMGQKRSVCWRWSSSLRACLLIYRRSGKSSITSVVFHKMPPQETLFLESTTRIQKDFMQ